LSEKSGSNKNLLQFTIKLTSSQLEYLEDLAEALGLSTQPLRSTVSALPAAPSLSRGPVSCARCRR